MRVCMSALAVVLLNSPLNAGFEFNQNFTVFTPAPAKSELGDAFAERVLQRAEEYRLEIAEEWLGEPLADGLGKTTINVKFSSDDDSGLTWAKESSASKIHMLYLRTSPERALGSTLKHEMAHIVLATRFPHPHRLPAWLEEGIASRYDDPGRHTQRSEALTRLARQRNWPRLEDVLFNANITAADEVAYTVATSLVEMLLSRADKKTLLEFGAKASEDLEPALRHHYEITSVGELQSMWQEWVQKTQLAHSEDPLPGAQTSRPLVKAVPQPKLTSQPGVRRDIR